MNARSLNWRHTMSRVLIYGALTVLALYYLYLALGKFYGELD